MKSKIRTQRLAQYTGHRAAIYALTPGTSDTSFLSGGGEGWLVEWDLAQPDLGRVLAKIEGSIFALCHLQAEQTVVIGNREGGVHWVDLNAPEATKNSAHHRKGVFAIQRLGNNLFTAGGDGIFTKWSIPEQRPLESIQLSHQSLRSIAYHPARREFAIGASDHNIYLLDADKFTLKNTLSKAHNNSIFSLQYHPISDFLFSGSRDAHLTAWDTHTWKQHSTQAAHLFTINAITFDPKGQYLATASRDKTLKIWDAKTLKLLKVLEGVRNQGHFNSINHLLWTDHGLFSCSDDRTIIQWEIV